MPDVVVIGGGVMGLASARELVAGGNVDNRRLCRALEIAIRRAGVRIMTGTEVRALSTSGGRVSGVRTNEGNLGADLVLLAAGAWSANIENATPKPPVTPQKGQIFALDQTRVGVRHVLLTPGDPYFVPRADGRLVIGATREEAGWDPLADGWWDRLAAEPRDARCAGAGWLPDSGVVDGIPAAVG